MRSAFSDAITAEAKRDPRVLLLTGDHGYALFDSFRKRCPEQYINCGIAEQNMVGVAAGLARAGFRPIVYGLAAFVPVRVLEQIKIDVCYERLPVIFIGDGAGLVYSHLGTSHQSTEDIACTRSIPDLTVLSPADRFEMAAALAQAFDAASPVYLRMGKSDRGDVHRGPVDFSAGQMIFVKGGRSEVVMLATGSMVKTALELTVRGVDAQVWSVPSIKPLDSASLGEICRHAKVLITLEEHSVFGGLGSCIAEEVAKINPVPICRIGIEDRFSALCGSYDYLLKEHGIDLASVKQRVDGFLQVQLAASLRI
ncbi:MAG: transketolase [Proteobacteria bacterium]|nr:transketolase [Pseudomonadota bacterium]